MKMPSPILLLALLMTVVFTLATYLEPRIGQWTSSGQGQSVLAIAIGDGRKMFANHFYNKADEYFHSGFYPSIFDQARRAAAKDKDMAGGKHDDPEEEARESMAALRAPRDWIDAFGRNFYPNTHTHLDKPGAAREILPWLRLSADLDPQLIANYVVAAYWLRVSMHKPAEAEQFLRDGLRANPNSYEILNVLAKIYDEDHHDPDHARNLWELALQHWREQDEAKKEPDQESYREIVSNLAQLEEKQGNLDKAMYYLQLELKSSPFPAAVQTLIDDLKKKQAAVKRGN
jgi:tetratricopeptide (TPR) repeat protein